MSTLQSSSCRCQARDLFGSISILTQHSLQVPEAFLVPTCYVRGAQCPFPHWSFLVAIAGQGLWPLPARRSCRPAELWDAQGQDWRIKPSELCLSSPGQADLVFALGGRAGGSSWVGASPAQPHFMGTCKVEVPQNNSPGPHTNSCIQK